VIDKGYALDESQLGKQVLDTIVEKVVGSPGEDTTMLMLGYERGMADMMREANPGLARRMNAKASLCASGTTTTPPWLRSCLGCVRRLPQHKLRQMLRRLVVQQRKLLP